MGPVLEVHEGYTFPLNPVWPVRDKGWWAAGLQKKEAFQDHFPEERSVGVFASAKEILEAMLQQPTAKPLEVQFMRSRPQQLQERRSVRRRQGDETRGRESESP